MTELKVFIAGSTALEPVRDAVRSALSNVSIQYEELGYVIKSYSFENFANSLSIDGRQKDYNDFIREDADYVIFIMDKVLGEKTMEEFECAIDSLYTHQRPKIFVYNNISSGTENEVIRHLKSRLSQLNQYWTDYIDGQLKHIVTVNFNQELFNLIKNNIQRPLDEREEVIRRGKNLYNSLNEAVTAVIEMVQNMVDDGVEFKKQIEANESLKQALLDTRKVIPNELHDEAFSIAKDYVQNGFNWVLKKVREDIANGKEMYSHEELLALQHKITHELIPLREASDRINAFGAKLADYLNSI